MKKIIFSLGLLAISFSIFAQKREVTSTWSYLKDGFLDDAKKSIDKAAVHADTKEWYRTFYFKGQVYQELGITENKKYKSLCGENCLDISYEAYLKSIRLNFTDPANKSLDIETQVGFAKFVKIIMKNDNRDFEDTESLIDILMNRLPALSNAFVNQGVSFFQSQKFGEAYDKFEKAMDIATLSFKLDTQLVYFTSIAALRSDKFKEAQELNSILIKANYGANEEEQVGIYLNQSQAYAKTGDTVKMLDILEKGIQKFPNSNYPLVIETFNYYVNKGESQKAFGYINIAIDKNPNDPQFYVIKGTLLEEMKKKAEAQVEYENALKIDSENFDANYSLGAFYYNSAVDTLDWAEKNIPINQFAEMNKYKDIANVQFGKSLPYLEKSYSLQPKNLNVLTTLRTIYYRLGKNEEFEKVKAEIDVLTKPE